jgi:uncharacterized protein (DUF885 family)
MKYFISSLLILSIYSCSPKANRGDSEFGKFTKGFIQDLWKQYPGWATGVGYHNYDSILVIPNQENRDSDLAFSKRFLDSLASFNFDSLSPMHKTEYLLIQNSLEGTAFYSNEFKSHEWDASGYNFGSTLFEITQNKNATKAQIIDNLNKYLAKVPSYYEAAKANLTSPTLEHTELAISQLAGTADMLETGEIAQLYKTKKADTAGLVSASRSIHGFIDHLKKMKTDMDAGKLKPKDFRIGKELFNKKFDIEIASTYSADEMYKNAQDRKKSLTTEMHAIASRLWFKYLPNTPVEKDSLLLIKKLIDKVALKHCARDKFQSEIEREIPILTQFITDKNLVTMDPTKPLVVRKEPEWMAGVAGASISSPGPYDKNGNTYYNVGSLAAYTPEAAESYLREYNNFTLQILNIHEAIPGHYVQLIHANKSPSLIQTLMSNGAFVEGWALYAERMMMEEGWDKNTTINPEPMSDEMWLMYYKFHLRGDCNTILDYSIHSLGMTKEQALNIMMNEAFQEKSEAEGKWKRATLTQVQLCSYFTGFYEIYNFRKEIKEKQGDKFNLKAFNDKLLSFGAPPVKYIKDMFGK